MNSSIVIATKNRGSALVMVLILSFVTLLILASTLQWSTTNATLVQRNNEYHRTVEIAEAATEKVITRISSDYQSGGDATVMGNLSAYRGTVPLSSDNALLANYQFTDGQGQAGKTYVEFIPPSAYRVLTAQYRGLYGYSSIFRIISNARETSSRFNIVGAVRQDVEVATIPLFQFAIFYNLDLEINPGPVMVVTGPVHGNGNIYTQPGNTLTFNSDVTAAGEILRENKPGDPTARIPNPIVFIGENDSEVSALNLPIGTNNNPVAVRQVIEKPPLVESPASPLGKERFYNKADLIITVTSSGTAVTSGLADNFGTTIPQSQWDYFIDQPSFYNKRENKNVNAIELNVGALNTWNATNTLLRPLLRGTTGGDVTIVYVIDQRNYSSGVAEPGVRLVNGATLPPKGLTVATPDPIYVQGDYNAPPGNAHDTSGTKPAALIGDAITVLSRNWSDANSAAALGSRVAKNTTVNAAFLAGIVETSPANGYSGGVENFPRFLEDWSNKSFVYNGSMVVMYDSAFATGLWRGTGSAIGIYNPPNRDWAFDLNFRDPTKLPPGTPCVRTLIRSTWAMIKPNTTTVVTP